MPVHGENAKLSVVDDAVAVLPRRSAAGKGGPDDAELVSRALSGDRWAEEALYHRHVRAVTGVTVRLLGRTAEAEDVVQDSFVSALERLDQLREPRMFRAWLVRIAVHHVHRRFRRHRMRRALGLQDGLDDASLHELAAPGTDAERIAELGRIDDALRVLPPKHRVAWMLRNVEGWRLRDVASMSGTSLASVKRWIAKADAVVARHVGRVETEEANV